MRSTRLGHLSSGRLLLLLAAVLAFATPVTAQPDEQAPRELRTSQQDPTDPQPVEIVTKDGVLLAGTFFPAEEAGEETPIVVLLADKGESPVVFERLALRLQSNRDANRRTGFSVLAIALRGQGDSTRVRLPSGEVVDRRGARLTPADAAAMVKVDMEAVRQFLVDKNDAGELNLNRLGYLGVGHGALVAMNAAAVDWSVPELNRGKQGRDVKALVLVSPPWQQLGLSMLPALRQPGVQSQVAVLVTYGNEETSSKDQAERIIRQLEKERPRVPEPVEGEPAPVRTVVDYPGETKLQGTAWLKLAGREGEQKIIDFLSEWLIKPEHPWTERRLR